jgi:hypothetical protein
MVEWEEAIVLKKSTEANLKVEKTKLKLHHFTSPYTSVHEKRTDITRRGGGV